MMDEDEGSTLYDATGNADGLFSNDLDATFDEPALFHQSHGSSIGFDGEAFVDLSTGPFDYVHQTAEFTIIGFVKPAQLSTQMPVVTSSQATAHKGFRVDIVNGTFRAILTTGSANRVLNGTSSLALDTAHMFAFVGDGTTLSLYVDGALEATTSAITGTGGATFPTRIGRFPTTFTYLEGGVDELAFLNRGATAEEIGAYFVAATNEVAGYGVMPVCDPAKDLWECECPNMQGFGSCDIVNMTTAMDFADPESIDRTDWISTTYDSGLGMWVVEVDVDEMPSEGLVIAPPNEGWWDDESHLFAYLSDLLDVPIDSATGELEPHLFRQFGHIAVYYSTSNVLAMSRSLWQGLVHQGDGKLFIDGQEVLSDLEREGCPSFPLLDEQCEHPTRDQCVDEMAGTSSDGAFEATASSSITIYDHPQTPTEAACATSSITRLRLNGEELVDEPDAADVAQTNPLHCVVEGSVGVLCTFYPLDELVPPVGMPVSHPSYFDELQVRRVRVRADMEMDVSYWIGNSQLGTDFVSFPSATSMVLQRPSGGLPMNATCMDGLVDRDDVEVELGTAIVDARASTAPACAE